MYFYNHSVRARLSGHLQVAPASARIPRHKTGERDNQRDACLQSTSQEYTSPASPSPSSCYSGSYSQAFAQEELADHSVGKHCIRCYVLVRAERAGGETRAVTETQQKMGWGQARRTPAAGLWPSYETPSWTCPALESSR